MKRHKNAGKAAAEWGKADEDLEERKRETGGGCLMGVVIGSFSRAAEIFELRVYF
jgi:hypothetical protein